MQPGFSIRAPGGGDCGRPGETVLREEGSTCQAEVWLIKHRVVTAGAESVLACPQCLVLLEVDGPPQAPYLVCSSCALARMSSSADTGRTSRRRHQGRRRRTVSNMTANPRCPNCPATLEIAGLAPQQYWVCRPCNLVFLT